MTSMREVVTKTKTMMLLYEPSLKAHLMLLLCSGVLFPTILVSGFSATTSIHRYRPSLALLFNHLTPRRRRTGPFFIATTTITQARESSSTARTTTQLYNLYDDWSNDLLSSSQSEYTYDELILPLEEECIEQCLEEFMDSDYGKSMFGKHDLPASVGITGSIEFSELDGPEVILTLTGKFWHRRGKYVSCLS